MIKYFYFRDSKGFPVGCLALNGNKFGITSYDKKDKFNKVIARKVAAGRAQSVASSHYLSVEGNFTDNIRSICRAIVSAPKSFETNSRVRKAAKRWLMTK